MNDLIKAISESPEFTKYLLSISALVFVAVFIALFRRIINILSLSEERKSVIRHWVNVSGIGVFLLAASKIWFFSYLSSLFNPNISGRIISSALFLIIIILSDILTGRLVIPRDTENEKKKQYQKLINAVYIALYMILLVQIWSEVRIFKNITLRRILYSAISFAVMYVSLLFTHRIINSLKIELSMRHVYRKRATYFLTFIFILSLVPIWAGSTKQWATVFSVTGAGIALALRDVLLNFAGWFYIIFRRPYREGDRIEIDNIKGDVIDLQLFQTTLLEIGNWVDGDQSTGRMVHLPNGRIFQSPLYNYTKGFEYIWDEVSILITFESNRKKAEEILLLAGDELSQDIQHQVKNRIKRLETKYLIYYNTFTPIVYTAIEESGVKLTLRFLTETKKRRQMEDMIARTIMDKIEKLPDVTLAYPTVRIYKKEEQDSSTQKA
ncbi:hypothetical protein DRQ07_09900 [candidate division KSB1 bacterium]|nr:MAG: hypothetical protein DRQ07_09900 [candidate division KSB1 bacterium]